MQSNAATELVPLDSLWAGSEKVAWEIIPSSTESSFPIWLFFGATLIICLVLSGKLPAVLSGFIPSLTRPLSKSRNITFPMAAAFLFAAVFSSILTAGSLSYFSLLPPGNFHFFLYLCLAILAAKSIILTAIGEISGVSCFRSFISAFIILFSIISVLLIITAFCIYLFPVTAEWDILFQVTTGLVSLSVLVYFYRVSITLFSAGISPFYSFLYLCTVEIIPVCVIATMISRL